MSASKDGLFKVWDLDLQASVDTVSSQNNEIWSMCFNQQQQIAILGTNTQDLLVIKLEVKYKDSLEGPTSKKQIAVTLFPPPLADLSLSVSLASFTASRRCVFSSFSLHFSLNSGQQYREPSALNLQHHCSNVIASPLAG